MTQTYVWWSSGFILANRPSGKAAEGRMSMLGYFLKIIIMILSNMFSVPRVSQVRCHLQGCLKGVSHIVFTGLSDRLFGGRGGGFFFLVLSDRQDYPLYTFFNSVRNDQQPHDVIFHVYMYSLTVQCKSMMIYYVK